MCVPVFETTNQCCSYFIFRFETLALERQRTQLLPRQIAEELKRKSVNLQVLDQNIDTGDATGRLLFNMLGAIAQFETEIRAERQMDGIKKAKERGVHFGRKKTLTKPQIAELQQRRRQGDMITLVRALARSKR